jgi:arylsulfatase A-like enzyme
VATPFSGYQADVVCGRAADWFSSKDNRGRFCVVSLEAPHPPYDAPAAGAQTRDPGAIHLAPNVPRGGEAEAQARIELAGYYAHIESTDRAIGRLVDAVGACDSGPTIIVFTSAHGDMHGAHGLFRKGWPHEESIRVPLLVRGAAVDSRGAGGAAGRSDALVSLLDLPSWTLGWANPSADRPRDSVFPRSPRSESQIISMPSVVRQPRQCDRVWRGWRTAGRKLVLNGDGTPWLLFDLENDPFEMNNLAVAPA